MTPNFAQADGPLPLGRVGPRSVSLGELVRRVQDYEEVARADAIPTQRRSLRH
jgi:hypothetical protein